MNISRESIFLSSLRSFCMSFFAVLGIAICGFLIVFFVTLFKGSSSNTTSSTKLILASDAEGKKAMLPLHSPVILKINIEGLIGDRKNTSETVRTLLQDSREHFLKNGRVKGILLNVNTPGGCPTDSNGIYEALLEYRKRYNIPVFAFVDGTCASGGMYVTSAAEKIYATNVSIIGSVGVMLGPAFNFVDLLNQYGVQVKTITKGIDKGILQPFTNWDQINNASLENITSYLYTHFVDIVTKARPKLDKDLLINEYGAQVYAAPVAEKLGYIDDGNSSYSQALKELVKAAGIQPEEKYQVVEIRTHTSILKELIENKSSLPSSFLSRLFNLTTTNLNKHPFLYLYRFS